MVYDEIVAKTTVWKDLGMCARMWSAWYYSIRIRAADKFDMRARAARVASWDRNVKTQKFAFL